MGQGKESRNQVGYRVVAQSALDFGLDKLNREVSSFLCQGFM